MRKLSIQKGNEEYNLFIDRIKLITGSNYNNIFNIKRTLIRYFEGLKETDYSQQFHNKAKVLLDEKLVDVKRTFFYYINPEFSLNTEYKLGAKNLLTKYIELVLNDPKYVDTLSTLNILFDSLGDELFEEENIFAYVFNSMSPKQLIKLVTPSLIENGYVKDEYDLSLEELVNLQISMVDRIVEISNYEYYLILVDIPYLTENIYNRLLASKENIKYVVLSKTNIKIDIDNYCICEKETLDVADENQFYELICDNNINLLNFNEGRDYMNEYLRGLDTEKARFIKKLL